MMPPLGKALVIGGAVLIVVGLLLMFWQRLPWLGKLPGDFSFTSGGIRIYLPLATSILLSLLLTILFNIFRR